MATDSAGNVYVSDIDNDTIRKVTPAGLVTNSIALFGTTLYTTTNNAIVQVSNVH